jgi:opacity protein-like surface antigen
MKCLKLWLHAVTIIATLGVVPQGPSWAQGNRVPSSGEQDDPAWRFTFTPQLWISSLAGRAGVGGSVAEVDLSYGDIFGDLNFGMTGLFEARRHPWAIRADLLFLSVGEERALSADGSGTLQLNLDELMLHPELGFTILTRPWGGVDLMVGARYWHVSLDLSAPPQDRTGDEGWIDGTIGAGLRFQPAEGWHVLAKADAGAGGSDFTWQALGGGGYDISECCTLVAAYRYLDVDYEQSNGLTHDVSFHGPAIGLTLHF